MKDTLRLVLLIAGLVSCGEESACDALVADATTCYDGYCDGEGADTALCGCWAQGMDISTVDCSCVPLRLETACFVNDLSDYQAGDLDCDAALDAVRDICTQ